MRNYASHERVDGNEHASYFSYLGIEGEDKLPMRSAIT